ncbi:hypothetical protein N0V93_001166 [Gnomoniopsis smithogilvyi]|uniref:Uncharacterized protein n=1 Tax=Gnomoniopsis smithogilvyi TaxID=1191159 RepID=A0A9W8Z523_9PEZI|nr:hypothetical protein N0V93_001166 [Gnomoniopsis smithogilvyi]
MVPTSAVRETLILILFGIILVPIAAKRAQDARGYWQTFQLQDLATTIPYDHATTPLVLAPSIIQNYNHIHNHNDNVMAMAQQNESSLPAVPAVVYATSSAPRAETARTGLTIRFGSATAAGEAMATTAPRLPQQQQQQKQKQKQHQSAQEKAEELPAAAKMSDASKGRWTLIWMGSAIAAVAVFMSLC